MKIAWEDLIRRAKKLTAVHTAVVHPVTVEALQGAIDAAKQHLIVPLFIGPKAKIMLAAKHAKLSLDNYEIVDTPHSHAAADHAVELVHAGKAKMLMKGSLHTDEFMQAIVNKENGLRTDRRMSHVFIAATKSYPKLLLLTDCVLNIAPTLMEKRDVVQNVIDLAIAIGINAPKVAILSAIETITDKIPSTIEAAALCKMADRKQIQHGILDGPLAFDNAISINATRIKEIESPVAGNADILVAPNMEAGNMLVKQLEYLAHAKLAGIVVGARVPVVLTSRADNAETRLVSSALGVLYGSYLWKK